MISKEKTTGHRQSVRRLSLQGELDSMVNMYRVFRQANLSRWRAEKSDIQQYISNSKLTLMNKYLST